MILEKKKILKINKDYSTQKKKNEYMIAASSNSIDISGNVTRYSSRKRKNGWR